ncbi:hypothetical protein CP533_2871 [Ophiocordyceps camponoti-saundersi (nom. inval.)]|nr:hypothetical protein CP533_2871 [Ophiocordyceps camponoti-saundersi (nom. inval.)]
MIPPRWSAALAMALTTTATAYSELDFNLQMETHAFGYVVVHPASHTDPAYFKEKGGIAVQDANPTDDAAWLFNDATHWNTTWISVHRDLKWISRSPYQWHNGTWVYKLALSPHIVDQPALKPDPKQADHNPRALGGIFWSQIHSWTHINENGQLSWWQTNSDYDSKWEDFGMTVPQHLFSNYQHLRKEGDVEKSAREVALFFVGALTSTLNVDLTDERRQTLQKLMDWSIETDPWRDFPLLRRKERKTLISHLITRFLRQVDWFRVNLKPQLIASLASGLASDEDCMEVDATVFDTGADKEKVQDSSEEGEVAGTSVIAEVEQKPKRYNCETLTVMALDKQPNAAKSEHTPPSLKPEHLVQSTRSEVYVCQKANLASPCTKIRADNRRCVDVPMAFRQNVSSVRPQLTSGNCYFFTGNGCSGEKFEASYPGLSLAGGNLHSFVNKTKSVRCNSDTVKPCDNCDGDDLDPRDKWVWTDETRPQLCSNIVELWFNINLTLGFQAGSRWLRVDLQNVFGADMISLDRLKMMEVMAYQIVASDRGQLKIIDAKLFAWCHKTDMKLWMDRFISNPKREEPTKKNEGSVSWQWKDKIELQDWIPESPCSYFEKLSVTVSMKIPTKDGLYVDFNNRRLPLANVQDVGTHVTDIDMENVWGTKRLAPTDIGRVSIINDEKGADVLVDYVALRGICVGSSVPYVMTFRRGPDEWLNDGETWTLNASPRSWVRSE